MKSFADQLRHLMKCPYCEKEVSLVTGKEIYPHRPDLYSKPFYQCSDCDAYVGCHPNTTRPLGRLANKELRDLKVKAHAAFDPMWRSGRLKRSEAYAWLAEKMDKKIKETHIGYYNADECRKVIEVCSGKM